MCILEFEIINTLAVKSEWGLKLIGNLNVKVNWKIKNFVEDKTIEMCARKKKYCKNNSRVEGIKKSLWAKNPRI